MEKKKSNVEKVRVCVLKRGVEPRTFRELNNISSFWKRERFDNVKRT